MRTCLMVLLPCLNIQKSKSEVNSPFDCCFLPPLLSAEFTPVNVVMVEWQPGSPHNIWVAKDDKSHKQVWMYVCSLACLYMMW